MTVQITLPPDVERKLLAEVDSGRYRSLEQAVLHKLIDAGEIDYTLTTDAAAKLRIEIEEAWNDRSGSVDADEFFNRLEKETAPLRAKGK